MNEQKGALLLVGSPKRAKSTSESIGTYLLNKLHEKGFETEMVRIYSSIKSEEEQKKFLSIVDGSDILMLAFPLYVDSLPSSVIRAMEMIADHRKVMDRPKKHRFLAISNCGFAEAKHNDTALAICRRFAFETGIQWAGGLGLGMGEAIHGKPLEKLGFMIRNVKKSLDLTASSLAAGERVPQKAVELMARRFMPIWMYLLAGSLGWKRKARKNKVSSKINDRPYQG